jgi:biopolymer transport protein ExbB
MQEIWKFLEAGGVTMIPLGLCSLIGLAIILERGLALRRKSILVPEVVSVVESIRSPQDISLVLAVCEKHEGPLASIFRTALQHRHLSPEELKEIIGDQGRQEIRVLERGLVALETIAAITPLLGLFGTVIGIFKIFGVISEIGVGQAKLLSAGIGEALITTIAGLAVAIPALVAYNYLTNRAENFVMDIEKHTTTLLMKIRGFQNNFAEKDYAIS